VCVAVRSMQLTKKKTKTEYKALDAVLRTTSKTGERVSIPIKCAELDKVRCCSLFSFFHTCCCLLFYLLITSFLKRCVLLCPLPLPSSPSFCFTCFFTSSCCLPFIPHVHSFFPHVHSFFPVVYLVTDKKCLF
jgi:hypothetical protein